MTGSFIKMFEFGILMLTIVVIGFGAYSLFLI